jgi:hypothetical protein
MIGADIRHFVILANAEHPSLDVRTRSEKLQMKTQT